MRIALGSLNPAKRKGLDLAVVKVFPEAEIFCVNVPSGVPDQPTSDEETMIGAMNRARAAREATDADMGVGMEGGYTKVGDKYFLCGWCVVSHRDGRYGYGATGRLELSSKIINMLEEHKVLGDVMDALTGRSEVHKQEGIMGVISCGHVPRDASFATALLFAFGRFNSDPIFWE